MCTTMELAHSKQTRNTSYMNWDHTQAILTRYSTIHAKIWLARTLKMYFPVCIDGGIT